MDNKWVFFDIKNVTIAVHIGADVTPTMSFDTDNSDSLEKEAERQGFIEALEARDATPTPEQLEWEAFQETMTPEEIDRYERLQSKF